LHRFLVSGRSFAELDPIVGQVPVRVNNYDAATESEGAELACRGHASRAATEHHDVSVLGCGRGTSSGHAGKPMGLYELISAN